MPSIQIPVDVGNEAFECPTCGFPAQQHRYQCSVSKFPQMSNGQPLKNPFHDKSNSPKMGGQMGFIACTVCEV